MIENDLIHLIFLKCKKFGYSFLSLYSFSIYSAKNSIFFGLSLTQGSHKLKNFICMKFRLKTKNKSFNFELISNEFIYGIIIK